MLRLKRSPMLGMGLIAAWLGCGCNFVFDVAEGAPRDQAGLAVTPTPIYASTEELGAAKSRADAGDEPWVSGWRALEQSADEALSFAPRSVVGDGGAADGTGDPQAFATDADADAETCAAAPEGGRADYCAALDMSRAARDLSLAFAMTGTHSYAVKAVELLHHWFVATETAMKPAVFNAGPKTSANGSGSNIEIYLIVPTFVYAASHVRGHARWAELGADSEAVFSAWLEDYLTLALANREDNSGANFFYWVTSVAATSAYLQRPDDVAGAIAMWRTQMLSAVDTNGTLVAGSNTANAWFILKGITLTAQLGSYHGEDLYTPTLRRAFDTYAPCASGDTGCPNAGPLDLVGLAEGASIYELAHARWADAAHLQVVEAAGRPVRDIRVLGVTTITHGDAFSR